MIDSRFYDYSGPQDLAKVAEVAGASLPDGQGDTEITHARQLADARSGHVAYFEHRRHTDSLMKSSASAIFVKEPHLDLCRQAGAIPILTRYPQAAFSRAMHLFYTPKRVSGEAFIAADAEIHDSVIKAPGVVVGEGAKIGEGTRLGANCVIGPGVQIGAHCRIGAGAVIEFTIMGNSCVIGANAVLGHDGFGIAPSETVPLDVPHICRVVLDDHVSIGACTTIDRGMFVDTHLSRGVKIDNLSQIAHNVFIDEFTMLAAHAGISGSTRLGKGVTGGGRVGIADHLTIGDRVRLAANCAIMDNIPDGATWAGAPAKPIRTFFREITTLSKLAERDIKTKKSDNE